jgi:hypothetical protein
LLRNVRSKNSQRNNQAHPHEGRRSIIECLCLL